MDVCSREYMFASELVTYVMQLYSSTWETDIKPLHEKDSPFTSGVEEAIYFIWNEKKEFINDLFSTVLKFGTINVTNYEVPVKFASHLVTEAEYDEIELLRYCVIAAGYATLFFQNGLKDVPDRCLYFIYDAITTFKSKNEFNDESWFDVELLGQAYCKSFSDNICSNESTSSVLSSKSEDPSSTFQTDVSGRNAIKTKNNVPSVAKKSLQTCITSEHFSCRATTSKESCAILPRTRNVKRKRPRNKRAVKKNVGNFDLNSDTKAFTGEVAELKNIPKKLLVTTKYKKARARKVTYRSKKVAKEKNKFPKNIRTKDSSVKVEGTQNFTLSQLASKTTAVSGTLSKCNTRKVKSERIKDATEKNEVIDFTGVIDNGDCDNVKETEYTITKLNGTILQINKVTGSKCKSKTVKSSSKQKSQKVTTAITPTEKNADDRCTFESIKSNKDIEQEVQAIRPKTNTSKTHNKTKVIKGNKDLVTEVSDFNAVAEKFMLDKYVSKKGGKVEENHVEYNNVEPSYDNVSKVKHIDHDSAVENINGLNTNVKNVENCKKVSECKLAQEERKHKIKKDKTKNEPKKSLDFIVNTLRNRLEKEVEIHHTNESQEYTIDMIEEVTTIKSRLNKSTNVIAKSQETIYAAKEGLVKTKRKTKLIKGSTNAFSANATNNYGDKEVAAEITNENVAETEYGNNSNKREEPRYEEVNGEIGENRYASKTCIKGNKLKPIQKAKKIKVLKYKNKRVGFKAMIGKIAKRGASNKNLKRNKLPATKPSFGNSINYGKCVPKFAELDTACENSSTIPYSNENVQFPFASNDKEIIEKHAKMRSPLSKISTNCSTELEGHDPQIKNKE